MRRAFFVVACLVATSASEAQSRKYFGMFALGPALPVGTFGDGFGMGWSVLAGVGTTLANQRVEVRGTATYGSFGENGDFGGSAKSTPLTVTGDVLYHLGEQRAGLRAYLVGGAGLSSVGYSSSYSYEGAGGGGGYSERENGVVVGAGAGFLMHRGRASFFTEGRLSVIPGSGHSHLPITAGVRLGGR